MKDVKLDRLVDAYRDACCAPLDDTALKRRINRTLRERAATNRQRPWLWLFGFGGMLTASLASATPAGRQAIAWLQEQLPVLEQKAALPVETAKVPALPAKTRVARSAPSHVPAAASGEELLPDLAAVPASLADSGEARGPVTAPMRNARGLRADTPTRVPILKEDTANTLTALYERAFQLQFRQGNYQAALGAWNSYLSATPTGALVGEAQFHRAVCLVALGRYGDARTALSTIASGVGGSAYRARAHTLLQAIESASQR
jgi:TolA-binding protein